MFLQTDDQTIEDLRLFAQKERKGIYDIYNHTTTRGGEDLLEHMFRNPLSNQDAISRRLAIIAAFAQLQTVFPFEPALLDSVEKYISSKEEHNQTGSSSLGEKEISSGVSAFVALFHALLQFLQSDAMETIGALQDDRRRIMAILLHPALEPVRKERPRSRMSYAAITAFDILVRVKEKDSVLHILQFIYQLDVFISVARVASQRQFTFPVVHPKGSYALRLAGVYHPELKNPVPNTLGMDKGKNVVFLTGANMAGKSTFLRSFSTAVYIAHMGFPVAAREMEFPVMDAIFTTINLPDNLGVGASHFYAEVLRIKKIAAELGANKSLFVVFDELFRGTNVKDAHEGTVAIMLAFAGKKNSHFLISSHIVEASEALRTLPNIGFHYLPTSMNGSVPAYTYTLEEGITDDRHGMIIIRNEGILQTLANGKKRG